MSCPGQCLTTVHYFLQFFLDFFFSLLQDRVSLSSLAILELRDPPASASPVLGLAACTATTALGVVRFFAVPSSMMFFSNGVDTDAHLWHWRGEADAHLWLSIQFILITYESAITTAYCNYSSSFF